MDTKTSSNDSLTAPENQPWRVQLTCCGRDDGHMSFATWQEAEDFREAYTSGVGVHPNGYSASIHADGHKRSGVIVRSPSAGDPVPVGGRVENIVAGNQMERTLAEFERACEVHIQEEQRRPNPDNALIALLCDAVRLKREACEQRLITSDALSPEGQEGWQPIATAPKDGTRVLGFSASRTEPCVIVQWAKNSGWWTKPGCYNVATLTHWMPLPPAPSEQPSALSAPALGAASLGQEKKEVRDGEA